MQKAKASRGEGEHAAVHAMPKEKTAAKTTAKKATGKGAPATKSRRRSA